MRTLLLAAASAVVAFAVPASAAVTVTPGTSEGSTTDPLNGATVTSNSPILGGFSVQDAFGAKTSNPTYAESAAGGHVIFADGAGTQFINFNTASSVLLSGLNVFVGSDGTTNARQFSTVELFAGATANALTSLGRTTLAPGAFTVNYAFAPAAYQYFRFEGVNATNGARLLEIDGVAAVPEAATWAMMIAGFGLVGGAMRSRRRTALAAA